MPIPALPKSLKVSSAAKSGVDEQHYDASKTSNIQSGTNVFNRYEITQGNSGLDANSLLNNKVTADFYSSFFGKKNNLNIEMIFKSKTALAVAGSFVFFVFCYPKIKKIVRGK